MSYATPQQISERNHRQQKTLEMLHDGPKTARQIAATIGSTGCKVGSSIRRLLVTGQVYKIVITGCARDANGNASTLYCLTGHPPPPIPEVKQKITLYQKCRDALCEHAGEISASQLAERVGITVSQSACTLGSMISRGLVEVAREEMVRGIRRNIYISTRKIGGEDNKDEEQHACGKILASLLSGWHKPPSKRFYAAQP